MSTAPKQRKPRFMLRLILMLVAAVLIFGGVFAVKAIIGAQTNKFFDNMPQPASAVSAAEARAERWSDDAQAVGTLVAVNGTDVTTEAGGVVRSIEFEAGQPVRAGEVLVRLNTDNEAATLNSLETSARLAKVQADRWQQLGRDQLVSLDEMQQRVAASASAQAQADAQRALIAQKTIRAPFSGELGIRKVNLGQFVSPGTPIVSLQQLDPIYLDFTLPEQQMDELEPGTPIRATLEGLPGQVFEGTVTAIEPGVDPNTRNFTAQATLDNPDGLLRPGAFARVDFDLGGEREVVVIPQTAVSFNPYGNAVFVISSTKRAEGETDMQGQPLTGDKLVVTQRFITTGATRGDLIAVTDGLKPGERVATSGLLKLRNGAEVTINNKVQPSSDARPEAENR
ncbi:efflux RND transporter periplasmic adaptor subunit [Luteimonas kalidii]|uniref:Efflux RND transporter periplasmic adaptor subunit n=1 Tax=Luteimonas kalidii TaxID=3042025 RepID=A0ABT6JRU0_9GAMM|nr:efflux RND transporter periplasmic adaptor subunit [Luteimonas kalidii]MDH5833205.1 efflux RND transporter periplasmic adaptor subunit [Luteimonas kalidii]